MNKWKLAEVDISLIDEIEVNANEMSAEAYSQLKENIKKSGGLSSAVSCVKMETGRYIAFSGNHRLRACKELRYKTVPVIYADERDMTNDEMVALQISHNSIHGEDNKGILKRLFDEIQSVEFKKFAYINIDEIQSVHVDGSSFTMESEHYSVCLVLYRSGMENLKDLLGIVDEQRTRNDVVLLADGRDNEEQFLTLMSELKKKTGIKSPNVLFSKILEVADRHINELNT